MRSRFRRASLPLTSKSTHQRRGAPKRSLSLSWTAATESAISGRAWRRTRPKRRPATRRPKQTPEPQMRRPPANPKHPTPKMAKRMTMMRSLSARLLAVADRRPPDVIIGGADNPYLRRWWLIPRNRFFNIYLHHFMRSDDDRALHDHPWPNISILLQGEYLEHRPGGIVIYRSTGQIILRGPRSAHRIELFRWCPASVWTLFITGPRVREWGFLCPQGWRHWR